MIVAFVGSSAYVKPGKQTIAAADLERQANIALRQIGHQLMRIAGDTTSNLPPVQRGEDGRFILRTAHFLDYDSLQRIGPAIIQRSGITNSYTLALEDCENGEILLGFLWPQSTGGYGLPCSERAQTVTCYNISLALTAMDQSTAPPSRAAWVLLFPLALLLSYFFWPQKAPQEKASLLKQKVVNDQPLSPITKFNLATQTLTLNGTVVDLTYREAKLLAYFLAHPNVVLERATINAAVWGDEGLIVGRSLDVFVSRLRKKLKPDASIAISAVHGVGYKLKIGGLG